MGWFSTHSDSVNDYHALVHAIMLVFDADDNSTSTSKLLQNSFIRQLVTGFSHGDSQFLTKAQSMDYVVMASLLRKCSNFVKQTHAQTINAAIQETSQSMTVKNCLLQIARDCDIPINYLKI